MADAVGDLFADRGPSFLFANLFDHIEGIVHHVRETSWRRAVVRVCFGKVTASSKTIHENTNRELFLFLLYDFVDRSFTPSPSSRGLEPSSLLLVVVAKDNVEIHAKLRTLPPGLSANGRREITLLSQEHPCGEGSFD
jgi:hypothetical protein